MPEECPSLRAFRRNLTYFQCRALPGSQCASTVGLVGQRRQKKNDTPDEFAVGSFTALPPFDTGMNLERKATACFKPP